ncbi:MAG: tetratricopeptide repeat protein [Pseudanabaenaceae cyanobacterium]
MAFATSRNNWAAFSSAMGRYADALPLFEAAVDMAAQALGADYPNPVAFRRNDTVGADFLTFFSERLCSEEHGFLAPHRPMP